MSKVLCEREDIVAIADAVRNKTGNTDPMTLGGIVTGVNGIVTGTHSGAEDLDAELTEQESLISQLSTILDSKAAGSGSGGGASVETCTVTANSNTVIVRYGVTKFVDGAISWEADSTGGESSITINDVVVGSVLTLVVRGAQPSVTNGNLVAHLNVDMENILVLFYAVST